MDPITQFFSRLKKLAVTLESETVRLQDEFENRNTDGDSETTMRAMKAYHEFNTEVRTLKTQVQDQLAQVKAKKDEVSSFIEACKVMKDKVTKDIEAVKEHWEKYGYQAPCYTTFTFSREADSDDKETDENYANSAEGEEGSEEEEGKNDTSSLPKVDPPFTDVLRTPQLSNFGLSEMQLKRALARGEWCSEVPPMPKMNLPQPSLNTQMPVTPKCALRMDDFELQTPRMHDFGLTERTVCLNNDFTVSLSMKNVETLQRTPQDTTEPPVNSLMEGLQTNADTLVSPEPPVLCTPGFKIIKPVNSGSSPPAQDNNDPASPCDSGNQPTTPEVPAFQTPYVNRLVSTKKSAQQPELQIVQVNQDGDSFQLAVSPCNRAAGSTRSWEYSVPDIAIFEVDSEQMPVMPNLESDLGNSLQSRNAKLPKLRDQEKVNKVPSVSGMELDGVAQEFSLGTPHVRRNYQEPSTPEMPDLSSVTQDICKLVSQTLIKKTAVVHPHNHPENDRCRVLRLTVVSEREFQSLPSYLRHVSLHNLNQAVCKINKFTEEHQGQQSEFHSEELKRIISIGTKAPVCILCLKLLKRLEQLGGDRDSAVFRLITHN
ncbi:SKA complex subunit 3 [Pholidichthys leucotaenia]